MLLYIMSEMDRGPCQCPNVLNHPSLSELFLTLSHIFFHFGNMRRFGLSEMDVHKKHTLDLRKRDVLCWVCSNQPLLRTGTQYTMYKHRSYNRPGIQNKSHLQPHFLPYSCLWLSQLRLSLVSSCLIRETTDCSLHRSAESSVKV